MNLTGIISISGKAGLSKIVSQTRTGIIVESLLDGKRSAVHGAQRVSSLEDISIYTYEEDMPLPEVMEKIAEHADYKAVISHKSSAEELKGFMEKVLPNYDQERVYQSDIKKIVQWYNLLVEKDLIKEEEKQATEKEEPKNKKGGKLRTDEPETDNKAKKKIQKESKKEKGKLVEGYGDQPDEEENVPKKKSTKK
jgi:hypothetical protein